MELALTSGQVSKLLGKPLQSVLGWDRQGIITPSIAQGDGQVQSRLYSVSDLVCGHLVVQCQKYGISAKALKTAINHIQRVGVEKLIKTKPYLVIDLEADRVFVAAEGAVFAGNPDAAIALDLRPGVAKIKQAIEAGLSGEAIAQAKQRAKSYRNN